MVLALVYSYLMLVKQYIQQFSWQAVFSGMGSFYLILLITITLAKFEEKDTVSINKRLNNQPNSIKAKLLNISVILIALAIMIYVYIRIYCLILVEAKHAYKSYRCRSYHRLILGNYCSFTLSCWLVCADKIKPVVYIIISC